MAFSEVYKEGLRDRLRKVQVVEEKQVYNWKEDLEKILKSKTVKVLKFFARKRVKKILDTAEKLVQLIVFIENLGGWENFKNVIWKIIELGGTEETVARLEEKDVRKH
ncbi:hypothetical protein [Bernardetia sp.]|uniref:hypothetical protein n=1 Tax=Bernardetia sp. TaxID=1937974 RepID=UPI0025BAFF10|nr:hypothetical protein [Bernardetia sp.]